MGHAVYTPFTLDQLTTLLAVVQEGSFSGAGRRLGRVQSAVSYTIGQLESAPAEITSGQPAGNTDEMETKPERTG